MKNITKHIGLSQKVMALAIVAAFGPAHAENADEDVAQLTQPGSSVSVGLGAVTGDSKDRSIFGQYNGMREHNGYGLFDLDLVKRDDATGTWMILQGRNLGLDNRELNATMQKQGDWKVNGSYNEITHHEVRTINTGDLGVGTTTPTAVLLAAPGTGSDVDLKLTRKNYTFNAEKWLNASLLLEASFRNEDKDGARFTGRGYDCAAYVCSIGAGAAAGKTALLMQAEPINTNTKQFDLKLNFSGEKLNLTGGYYGSFFTNSNGSVSLTVPAVLKNGNGTGTAALYTGGIGLQGALGLPFALPPDNQAHQVYLDGNYAFTPTTKATFKYAYSRATQHEDFLSDGLTGAPVGRSSLDGRVDTTLLQVGLTAKPVPKLSLSANLRYEDKDDKTPLAPYNNENGTIWYNGLTSNKKVAGKLEASYQLPNAFRATAGIDYNSTEREVPTNRAVDNLAGLSTVRGKNDEVGYRLELRRAMSETLNGAIGYSSSRRSGSDWTSLGTTAAYINAGAPYGSTVSANLLNTLNANNVFPVSMADTKRDKLKLSADWSASDRLSLQFSFENGKDRNTTPAAPAGGKGWRDTGVAFYNVDAAYTVSDNWKLTAYASHGEQTMHLNRTTDWKGTLKDINDAVGVGVVGNPTGRLEMGANLSYVSDINKYAFQALTAGNQAQAAFGIPDVTFKQTVLSMFGKYAVDKNSDIRVDLVHQRAKLNEWAWGINDANPFVYGDNTTVSLKRDQSVTFVGARYIFKWR